MARAVHHAATVLLEWRGGLGASKDLDVFGVFSEGLSDFVSHLL
jgi:hypothetical protein